MPVGVAPPFFVRAQTVAVLPGAPIGIDRLTASQAR